MSGSAHDMQAAADIHLSAVQTFLRATQDAPSGQQIDEDQAIVMLAQAGFADCVIARILATCAGIQKERIGRSGANQGAPAHVSAVSECLIPKSTIAPSTSLATTAPGPISDSPGFKKGLAVNTADTPLCSSLSMLSEAGTPRRPGSPQGDSVWLTLRAVETHVNRGWFLNGKLSWSDKHEEDKTNATCVSRSSSSSSSSSSFSQLSFSSACPLSTDLIWMSDVKDVDLEKDPASLPPLFPGYRRVYLHV